MEREWCERRGKGCVGWVERYFGDCLCSGGDAASFGLGMASLLCWAAAELPQIVTNFRNKSAHGVSLLFLLTWILGDVFNLLGCLLEPSTLPTQFYTALLYTISTIILVLQGIYYDYVCQWWKRTTLPAHKLDEEDDDPDSTKHKLLDPSLLVPKAPLEVPRRRDFHYTSARSLAGSHDASPHRSYLRVVRSGPSALECNGDSSEDETSTKTATRPRRIPHSVGRGAFLAVCAVLPLHGKCMLAALAGQSPLQVQGEGMQGGALGQCLGWLMAAIYMGGRIPQIWLNIKRESVEGLNPLMFVFALTANSTYVGSILVRTTQWERIKANMPWLLDAIVCVALDFFIIMQYIYYGYFKQKKNLPIEEFLKNHEEDRYYFGEDSVSKF